jgi:hypothetical protein
VVRRKGKASFEIPDSSLVGFGTVSTVKTRLSAGNVCLHSQDLTEEG